METNSTLCTQRGAEIVTLDRIAALPEPEVLGKYHRPVPHIDFINTMKRVLANVGLMASREQYAIQNEGLKLFGVMDLTVDPNSKFKQFEVDLGRGLAVGFRTSNDKSMKHFAVGGQRVFVCDNMVLSGQAVILGRKHMGDFNLGNEIGDGVERLMGEYRNLETSIARLQAANLTDTQAKEVIYDAFVNGMPTVDDDEGEGIVSLRMLPAVNKNYFKPEEGWTDCEPRSKWGVYNAFTRALKDVKSPRVQFDATRTVGRFFGLGALN